METLRLPPMGGEMLGELDEAAAGGADGTVEAAGVTATDCVVCRAGGSAGAGAAVLRGSADSGSAAAYEWCLPFELAEGIALGVEALATGPAAGAIVTDDTTGSAAMGDLALLAGSFDASPRRRYAAGSPLRSQAARPGSDRPATQRGHVWRQVVGAVHRFVLFMPPSRSRRRG
jgi:hypothetical protein